MTKPKLTYFDFSGSRGEECRMALHLAGVDFEDERLSHKQWLERKPNTPYGSVPTLTIEGKGVLAQSNAILGFIAREHGLCPTEPFEHALHDALMEAVEELRGTVWPVLRIEGDARQSAREELAKGKMQDWASCVERQLRGPFAMGEQLFVADLKLFHAYNWFAAGVVDHIPKDVFASYPKFTQLYEAVAADPRIAEWRSRF